MQSQLYAGNVPDGPASRRLFAANIRRPEERVDLGLAALLVCAEEYPRLIIEDYVDRLDQLAAGLAVEIDLESGPRAMAKSISRYLHGDQGFDGDNENYTDPRNSYLSDVIDRRRGKPIVLSILYIEVARRVGVRLLPVSMPGHFLTKIRSSNGDIFIDPFNQGQILDAEGCREIFERLFGGQHEFRDSMLGRATKRQTITRLLQNLKTEYFAAGDYIRTLRIIDLLLTVTPWDLDQIRDRGLLRLQVGQTEEAVADLQAYADYAPPGPDVETVRQALRKIASR
jgi:regulator of sirC expression with transglutaminase-like and TPR domain